MPGTQTQLTDSALNFLYGGGQTGALMRARDWRRTPLGPAAHWPPLLKAVIVQILASESPMCLWWGEQYCQFYNDAYDLAFRPPGDRAAPGLAGAERWGAAWPTIVPDLEQVMATGKTIWRHDVRAVSTARSGSEASWWTFCQLPVNDDGAVQGVQVHYTDVSGAHLQRAHLEQSYTALIESMGWGFCIIDILFDANGNAQDYRVVEANLAFYRHTGLPPSSGTQVRAALPGIESAWGQHFIQVACSGHALRRTERSITFDKWFETYAFRLGAPGADGSCRVGVLLQDATAHVMREEAAHASKLRQDFSLALADALRNLDSADTIISTASAMLGRHLGIARVQYAEMQDDADDPSGQGCFRVRHGWLRPGVAAMPNASFRLDAFGADSIAGLHLGQPIVCSDVVNDPHSAPWATAYAAIGVRAHVSIPLHKGRRMVTILSLHHDLPRTWKKEEIAIAHDMAERTWNAVETARAQAQLRAERDQSQYVFDTMSEGFALLDAQFRIAYINSVAAAFTIYSQEYLHGKPLAPLRARVIDDVVENVFRRVQDTRVSESIEHPYLSPHGSNRWLDFRVYPTLNGGLAVFARDITDRKHAEEALLQSARRKDEFLAMLAHELRNPLAPISAAAQLMTLVDLAPERVRQTSQVIQRQVTHMTALVDDLLDVSRVTQGLVKISLSLQDMKTVVANAVEQVRPLIEKGRHHLVIDLPAAPASVLGDAKRLVQIFANLLNNAAKYTPAGGEIALTMEIDGADVLVHVRDNGVGIDAQLQPCIFDIFTQAERSIDRTTGGLGLGLALVRSLTELHQGTVVCSSAGVGLGSCFTVRLALAQSDHGSSAAQTSAASLEPPARRLRVLVVDDNVDAAHMMMALLSARGHEVQVAHTSQRALELARTQRPQVGLLDIGLPDMDGNALARGLLAQPESAAMLLIAVTGYGAEQDRETALAAGFRHYLVKPVDLALLTSLLEQAQQHVLPFGIPHPDA